MNNKQNNTTSSSQQTTASCDNLRAASTISQSQPHESSDTPFPQSPEILLLSDSTAPDTTHIATGLFTTYDQVNEHSLLF